MWKILFAALVLLLGACKPAEPMPALVFQDGWVRSMPPGVRMTAAYGELHNLSGSAITIDGFYSADYGLVELHETRLQDGQSSMHHVPELTLAAGEVLVLEPGGLHLMLMQPASRQQPARTSIEILSGEETFTAELVTR